MTGNEYAELVARYLVVNYETRGLEVYRELKLSKTIIGKNRRLDLFLWDRRSDRALALECKYQDSAGTVDEKLVYALADLDALPIKAGLVYAGGGFSLGILNMLEAAPKAMYCLPSDADLTRSPQTLELDHMLAFTFGWWDLVVGTKRKITVPFED